MAAFLSAYLDDEEDGALEQSATMAVPESEEVSQVASVCKKVASVQSLDKITPADMSVQTAGNTETVSERDAPFKRARVIRNAMKESPGAHNSPEKKRGKNACRKQGRRRSQCPRRHTGDT